MSLVREVRYTYIYMCVCVYIGKINDFQSISVIFNSFEIRKECEESKHKIIEEIFSRGIV